ncbi:hypothetical protein AAV94_00975 [Lampropedia cohaerens]|uniref:GDSL family lipase n=1 Tax=Lampropedia cohaerens TaxID=1610491 RepID=A0A0U1Q364_9BURK|nr:SGNH/GDSL hydrolase family protein [Lampropedia cohaerens]KKW69186.1 hypothetical protein AAV94_00975 [Lampropedia cohaerens]
MAFHWKRCIGMVAAGAIALGLVACGSSSVESQLVPTRVIAFGDGHSDIGQSGARYTVNDANADLLNWTEQVARDYGLALKPAKEGGLSYAQGNTRVADLAQQVASFLQGNQFGESDLVLISAGTSDLIAIAQAVRAGDIARDAAPAQARDAGRALGQQVKAMIDQGGHNIVVAGTYDLGKSIWARDIGETALLSNLSRQFNDGLLYEMGDDGYGRRALYAEFEQFINWVIEEPRYYSIDNIDETVCTSTDAGSGIGIGAGEVNAALCTTGTLRSTEYDRYAFADKIHFTPHVHRELGRYVYNRIRDRW